MLLVIPAIDLSGGRCVRLRMGRYADEADYFVDPVRMAKLWRVQNAKALHLANVDPDGTGNRAVIRDIAAAVDIPLQVGGGIRTMADVDELLEAGVYRVVLGGAALREPDFAEEAVAKHTCSRVVVGVAGQAGGDGLDPVAAALEMERRGVRRIVYTEPADADGPDLDACRALAERLSTCRLTVAGGVRDYRDLLRLQELAPLGLDSVILGRALYENRFACQGLWCWHDKEHVDLDRFSTARLAGASPTPPASDTCD